MAVNKLASIGGTSIGVVLPLDELRDEELVVEEGGDVKPVDEVWMRVQRFAPGAWQIVRADIHDYPAFHESPAYAQAAQATVDV